MLDSSAVATADTAAADTEVTAVATADTVAASADTAAVATAVMAATEAAASAAAMAAAGMVVMAGESTYILYTRMYSIRHSLPKCGSIKTDCTSSSICTLPLF
jgi:hypothetical protein